MTELFLYVSTHDMQINIKKKSGSSHLFENGKNQFHLCAGICLLGF